MPRKPRTVTVDQHIDAFVEKINASPREALEPDDVPPSLRVGPPDEFGQFDWRIERQDDIDWIEAVEAKLPGPLPPAFRSLVTRYVYPEFEVGGLWFFANTHERTWHEWRTEWETKQSLALDLLALGYVQFARPWESLNFDGICFNTWNRAKDGECPIVWIDHEAMFCDNRLVITRQVAPSFADFVRDYLTEISS